MQTELFESQIKEIIRLGWHHVRFSPDLEVSKDGKLWQKLDITTLPDTNKRHSIRLYLNQVFCLDEL